MLSEVREAREKAWYDIYAEGGTFLRDNRYQESLPVFEAANIIYDRRPEIMVILGQIYYQLGNYEKAIENFTQAIRLQPRDADAYVSRGAMHEELGNEAAARADYRRALEIAPGHEDAQDGLARVGGSNN